MKIAVEGCSHGELDAIYASILLAESKKGFKTDLLLLCGDFQAIRNRSDLQCLAVPGNFRQLGGFHRYYSGEKVAPVLTIVIGGNHEASNYMWELFHGGWLAPNIYYLGAAGCVEVGGLRIGGISGIYKGYDYRLGRFEKMPYNKSDIRSIYHTRLYDVLRLKLLSSASSSPTIILSHDWPSRIERSGDFKSLIRKKNFFTEEVRNGTLGSPPLMDLMKVLKPKYWFSAHLHVKFSCVWRFQDMEKKEKEMSWGSNGWSEKGKEDSQDERGAETPGNTGNKPTGNPKLSLSTNPEALDIDDDDEMMASEEPPHQHEMQVEGQNRGNPDEVEIEFEDEGEVEESADSRKGTGMEVDGVGNDSDQVSNTLASPRASHSASEQQSSSTLDATHFLALSKCLSNEEFLQFLDVPSPYDEYLSSIPSTSNLDPDSSTSDKAPDTIPKFQGSKIPLPVPNERRFPPLRYNPRWLAITRALHPFLCLERIQNPPLPNHDDPTLEQKVKEQEVWVEANLINGKDSQADDDEGPPKVDRHPLAVGNVQGFVKTAPTLSEPGGNENGPPPWYTNPQTESFCAFLQLPNLINPHPHQPQSQSQSQSQTLPPPQLDFAQGDHLSSGLRLGSLLPAEAPTPFLPASSSTLTPAQPPKAPAKEGEAEEIARIKESAEKRRKEREELKEKRKLELASANHTETTQ